MTSADLDKTESGLEIEVLKPFHGLFLMQYDPFN